MSVILNNRAQVKLIVIFSALKQLYTRIKGFNDHKCFGIHLEMN